MKVRDNNYNNVAKKVAKSVFALNMLVMGATFVAYAVETEKEKRAKLLLWVKICILIATILIPTLVLLYSGTYNFAGMGELISFLLLGLAVFWHI